MLILLKSAALLCKKKWRACCPSSRPRSTSARANAWVVANQKSAKKRAFSRSGRAFDGEELYIRIHENAGVLLLPTEKARGNMLSTVLRPAGHSTTYGKLNSLVVKTCYHQGSKSARHENRNPATSHNNDTNAQNLSAPEP